MNLCYRMFEPVERGSEDEMHDRTRGMIISSAKSSRRQLFLFLLFRASQRTALGSHLGLCQIEIS